MFLHDSFSVKQNSCFGVAHILAALPFWRAIRYLASNYDTPFTGSEANSSEDLK